MDDLFPGVPMPELGDNFMPDHPAFGPMAWPTHVRDFRPTQMDAIRMIADLFLGGVDNVYLEGPTGSGKTVVAEGVRRVLAMTSGWARTLYLCSTLDLQRQFASDFPYARVMWGKSHYRPQITDGGVTCADCDWDKTSGCSWCPDGKAVCEAEVAKVEALASDLAVLNTYYALTETAFVGRFKARDFAVFDEADTLEDEVLRFVEFPLSAWARKQMGLGEGPARVTKAADWAEYLIMGVAPAASAKARDSARRLEHAPGDVRAIRDQKRWKEIAAKAVAVGRQVLDGQWVFDHRDERRWAFKPVSVEGHAGRLLGALAPKRLLMSATLISADCLHAELGLPGSYATVTMPSSFPAQRRKVFVAPVTRMRWSERDEAMAKMIEACRRIIDWHRDERILVHTHSKSNSQALAEGLASDRVLTYGNSDERNAALEKFRATPGAVLLAHSLERGISLDDEACRVIVVAKVPWPSKGDAQVAARLYGRGRQGQLWYDVSTIRALVQMTGRGMRHEADWCLTYLLDGAFVDQVWKGKRRLLPKSWVEGLDPSFPVRSLIAPAAVAGTPAPACVSEYLKQFDDKDKEKDL